MTAIPIIASDLPLTAAGDLRSAELSPMFQLSFEYTVTNTEIGKIGVVNSGTVTQADAMNVVSTGTTTGSAAEWETVRHAKYRSGFGGLMRFTSIFTTGVAGTEQMIGLADVDGVSTSHKNGYGIGYNGSVFSFMRWQNDVLFPVAQADWDDPLDGTGPSGMTLDPTKLNVWEIRFQYLGGGPVIITVEDEATGHSINVHTVLYTNTNTVPTIFNPNFHLMIHALNGLTTSDMVIKCPSMAYFIEGKTKHTERQQPQQATGEQAKAAIITEVALFTIRNKTIYASLDNFIDLILELASASIEASAANNLGNIRLVRNATLGGVPSYTDINTTDSIVEIDVAGTTVTGGKELLSFPLSGKNGDKALSLLDFEVFLSPGETVTLAGSSVNSATIKASLLWKELF